MTKLGTKLSDEHKKNIGLATKKMWADGVFDSKDIRDVWRKTALSGIAKKGRVGPNKFVPSQEMLDDYSKMGDLDLSNKYRVSRRLVIKLRKEYKLPRFNNQHGTYLHEFKDGKEYKWCGTGHWELVENFGVHSSRYDGLRGQCKEHSNESSRKAKQKEYSTPEGKARLRFRNNQRKTALIVWEYSDELRAFELYENRCAYCGTPLTYKSVEFDHIVPVSKGGKTVPENMIPTCVKCNRGVNGKKAKDLDEWLRSKFGISYFSDCILENIRRNQRIIKRETRNRVESALKGL